MENFIRHNKYIWVLIIVIVLALIIIPISLFLPRNTVAQEDPWEKVPTDIPHTEHTALLKGPYETAQDVTRACLGCHPNSATEIMDTTHWTWESEPFDVEWREEAVTIGKANQINNFCVSAMGNQQSCTACHIGYGWEEGQPYDYLATENVDCLVCHEQTGTYIKGSYGNPVEGVDLIAAAQSVASPRRENCGTCHFNGGGGNGVKHGDLDGSLYNPSDALDVHMGPYDMQCIDCHVTKDHKIKGRLVADNITIDPSEQVACTDCHAEAPHEDQRVNTHMESIACQTCHVPSFALEDPTKVYWDWSTSGQDLPEDHLTYLKIKGTFAYEHNVSPTYLWFNGNLDYRYILGDPVAAEGVTHINFPAGSIKDPDAKIFPFKVHVAIQPYDIDNNYLLAFLSAGENGYWTTFDWDSAFKLGESYSGLPYSGNYGFTVTEMYWPSTHMVQTGANVLQCTDCHGESGRLDWITLGYPGDPIEWGSRSQNSQP
jgi:octaheme c-type cytochrome (tetrathionate reductase family)